MLGPYTLSRDRLGRGPALGRAVGLLALLLILLLLFPATARAAGGEIHVAALAPPAAGAAPATPLLAGWVDKAMAPIEGTVNSRRGMMMVGTIMMLLALSIIWWRRT